MHRQKKEGNHLISKNVLMIPKYIYNGMAIIKKG